MQKLIDKHVLYIFGIILLIPIGQQLYIPVISALLALILMELMLYSNSDKVILGVGIAFVILCFGIKYLVFFLPIIIYEAVWRKKWWGGLSVLLFFVNLTCFTQVWQIVLWWLSLVMAGLLAYRTQKEMTEHSAYISLRDKSVENALVMRAKNKELLDKQDYEVHLATLQERNRIAREIHDNVGHMLSRSILQMGALMMIHKEEPLHEQLQSVNDTLNEAMNNIRESVHDLHDEALDLRQGVYEAVKDMEKQYEVIVEYDMTPDVSRNVKYCFLGIIREAMSNVVKHSNAKKVSIMMREHPGFYQLAIEDDGSIQKKNPNPGIGLTNMKERVESLGGVINFVQDPGFKIMIMIKKKGKEK